MPEQQSHVGRGAGFRRTFLSLSALAFFAVVIGENVTAGPQNAASGDRLSPLTDTVPPALKVLSASDAGYYREAFELTREQRYDDADAVAARIQDKILMGSLLAVRYPGGHYHADPGQSSAAPAAFLKTPDNLRLAKNAGDAQNHGAMQDDPLWALGLAAFRNHSMKLAAERFRQVLAHNAALASEDKAALFYWMYRAELATGNPAAAKINLAKAAAEAPGFYSVLARHGLGGSLAPDAGGFTDLLKTDGVKRAVALKEIGQDALAEAEICNQFDLQNEAGRRELMAFARLLGLPGANARMALATATHESAAGGALYPVPRWMPSEGYRVSPALLFAIMRQESGFNPRARSASGAEGVMQLMPATAHAMAKSSRAGLSLAPSGAAASTLNMTPSVSMTLGQMYLERLMASPSVGSNLVYLTAAYNAGPGALAGWQRKQAASKDPLMFIESIPYGQTRDYVERVLGNYWIYSELLGAADTESLTAIAMGRWPRYEGSDERMTAMLSRLGAY